MVRVLIAGGTPVASPTDAPGIRSPFGGVGTLTLTRVPIRDGNTLELDGPR